MRVELVKAKQLLETVLEKSNYPGLVPFKPVDREEVAGRWQTIYSCIGEEGKMQSQFMVTKDEARYAFVLKAV